MGLGEEGVECGEFRELVKDPCDIEGCGGREEEEGEENKEGRYE